MNQISKKRPPHYWRNILFFALVASLVGFLFLQYVAHPYLLARAHAHPHRQPLCCQTPADYDLDFEEVSFKTADGLTLDGWYVPSENGAAVMLLHGIGSTRVMMLGLGAGLAKGGYGVLLLDLRAHGTSEGDLLSFGGPEADDVHAAVAYLQSRPDVNPDHIGAVGWSLGAQVAILGAASDSDLKAVVADGPGATTFADWPPPESLDEWLYVPYDFMYYQFLPSHTGVDEPVALVEALPLMGERPLLLISGGEEIEQHRLEYFLDHATEPKELWIIPEAGHIGGWGTDSEAYEARVIRFFDQALFP